MRRMSLLVVPTLLILACANQASVPPLGPSSGPAPVTAGFTLSGVATVSAPVSGDPCQGARVVAESDTVRLEADTGERGRYIIRGIPSGLYRITVSWDGYETVRRAMQISEDTILDFQLTPKA